jgi:phosphoserine phosphatase RsbU/P
LESKKAHLLIIGGHLAHLKTLLLRLEEAGYAVAAAVDGDEGLRMIKLGTPDLVLLDLHVAILDACEFLSQLRGSEAMPDIPVILLAPAEDLEGVERCLAAGADDYLLAPFSPTLLRAQVQNYLEIGRERQEQHRRTKQEELLKIERDVQIARNIQLSFLPSELPQPEGWELAARFHPAREVAGDFYDSFTLSQGRRVAVVIADVCDKGVGAALFMALIRSLTRAFAQQNYSLSWMGAIADDLAAGAPARRREAPSIGTTALMNAVVLTNNYITTNHMELNMFATYFFGMLDPANGQVAYINGGHNPPFIVGPDGVMKTCLKATGPAVGMVPNAHFRIEQAQLEPGDILYLYTDGVTEARTPTGEFFTEKRLESLLSQPPTSAAGLLDRVEKALSDWVAGGIPSDDITMMAVRRIPATLLMSET